MVIPVNKGYLRPADAGAKAHYPPRMDDTFARPIRNATVMRESNFGRMSPVGMEMREGSLEEAGKEERKL